MLTPISLAMLVALSGPIQTESDPTGGAQITLLRADSAHTIFTPNAVDSGRPGQLYLLPQGGFGVSSGGTSHYQTYVTPGGSGVAVPNGGNTFNVIGATGRAGTARSPG
jgi:hypothetical protein